MGRRIQNVAPTEFEGTHYRSTLEADTARILEALGIPASYEPFKFELVKGFRCRYQREKVQSITYTPDFILGDFLILECKGFETPEWKIKRKLLFKYLEENNPQYSFIQISDTRKSLIEALDTLWLKLGFAVSVTSKPKTKVQPVTRTFPSVRKAMEELGIWKPIGSILRSLTGRTRYVYNYEWKLVRINI